MPFNPSRTPIVWFLAVLALIASACQDQPPPAAQATIDALTAENARLATAVANTSTRTTTMTAVITSAPALSGTAITSAIPPITTAAEPPPVAAVAAAQMENTPLPAPVAQVALADAAHSIVDLRLDRAANRLYVTDSTGQLSILDATTYERLATLPASGALILDPAHQRLFVAPAGRYFQENPAIAVIDTAALTITGQITGATHVALDSANNRLFVGNRRTAPTGQAEPPVRLVDGATLQPIADLPAAGIPVYNPVRNELLILGLTVLVVDPAQNQIVQDLLPDLADNPCPDCVGTVRPEAATVFVDEGILAVELQTLSTAGGPGYVLPPRFFDAATLAPLDNQNSLPVLQYQCGSERTLQPWVGDRRYRYESFARYYKYVNWLIEDRDGAQVAWRDGLPEPFVNPNTGVAYAGEWVIDLASLQPVGLLPPGFCLFHHDLASGLLFGSQRQQLTVLAERGGAPAALDNQPVEELPAQAVGPILVSPAYAEDRTLFVVSGGSSLYRTGDDGQSWLHLRNGLLVSDLATLSVALSPNFAEDQTLFAGGARLGLGYGLFRSTDGGDSWQPTWTGLTHLRVRAVEFSPAYATDRTLIAQAEYTRIQPWETGLSLHHSVDGGDSWSLVLTTTGAITPSAMAALLPAAATPAPTLRIAADRQHLEASPDGGASWTPLPLILASDDSLGDVVPAPDEAGVFYVRSVQALWRLRDGGATIEQAQLDASESGETRALTALALSPTLDDGSHRLFLGDSQGRFWTLDPATVRWTPVGAAAASVPLTATTALTTPAPLTPTATLPASLGDEPPAGRFRPTGTFEPLWSNNEDLQRRLGWALVERSAGVPAAYQTFEQGVMIWRGDEQRIYVLASDGQWWVFDDTFREGDPESDPSLRAPENRLQPVRGFGKVWRDQPAVRAALGWATARESGITAQVQPFERGVLIWASGLIYALIQEPDGRQVWVVA
jgi:photosystem II stability/assembly factor-like uncharacterized protein